MPLKMALSRTCERPTKASPPAKSSPRVNPGVEATASYLPVAGSTTPSVPAPDSHTHSFPPCSRGECGIDRPEATTSPLGTSSSTPPLALFARQPAAPSVPPRAVTYRGRPSAIARPLRWQRSVGSSAEMNGGRHRGTKLDEGSSVQRQEKRVLTNHSSSPCPQAISWTWTLPVTWHRRGRKQ